MSTSINVKRRQLNIYFPEKEFRWLTEMAEEAGVSKSVLARNLVVDVLRDDNAAHSVARRTRAA